MPEKPGLRILLACGRPLVLKVQRWTATLDEEARSHLEVAADKLREAADLRDIEGRGKRLIFELYPPAPDADFLRKALKSVIPLKELNGEPAPVPIDAVRPSEEAEAVRQGLARIGRDVHVAVHGAATLTEIRELLNADPGFDVGHPDEALVHYKEALEIYREFFGRYPSAHARNFLIALRGAVELYEKLGMEEKVKECRQEMERVLGS